MRKTQTVRAAALISAILITASIAMIQPVVYAADIDPGIESQTVINNGELNGKDKAMAFFAAMASVGIACLASAYALARIGSAAMGAMSEKPELGGRAIIFLGMAEGIAIYGLIVAIMILNKL